MLHRDDENAWEAFATFAGYAYDASVRSSNQDLPIVSIADAGTSIVVLVDDVERGRLDAAVRPIRVLPVRQARLERKTARTRGHKSSWLTGPPEDEIAVRLHPLA